MLPPSLSMVFDGSGALVKRCDGFDGSLWSNDDDRRMMTMIMKMMMIRRPTETLKLLLGEAICCLFWGIYVHLGSREMSSTEFLGS